MNGLDRDGSSPPSPDEADRASVGRPETVARRSWTRWVWLAGSLSIATLASAWRWPDSAHAIGVLRQGGGSARHPVTLIPGPKRYTLVVTAPVLPPWQGDARLTIEGDPQLAFKTELSRPVVDLGFHHLPTLDGGVLRGLRPGDRIALWVRIDAPALDPVCGMLCAQDASLRTDEHCFCSSHCRDAYLQSPRKYAQAGYRGQQLRLVLRDEKTDQPVLAIPIVLGGKGDGHGHH